MNTNFKNFVLTTLALAAATTAVRAADVTGKWNSDFVSAVGPVKYTYDLKSEGTNVTGKAIRMSDTDTNETTLTEGSLTGSNISFIEPLSIGGNDVRIEYKGTVAGDEMKLTRAVGDFGSTNIVATRGSAAGVTGKWDAEFDGGVGHLKYTYDLTQAGTNLTGKAIRNQDDQKTETVITNGVVTGDAVTFVEPLSIQGQDLTITYTGKVAGDEMKLSRAVGEFATNDITAKKEK